MLDHQAPADRRPDSAARGRLGLTILGVLVATALTLPAGIHGDIKYEVGTQSTSPESPAYTFTHRPLPYRLLMSVLIRPADALTSSPTAFELLLRAEAAVLVLLAGFLLWLGLRRVLPRHGTAVAATVTGATLLMGANLALEPDWLAVVLTTIGVGAGLVFRRVLPSVLLGGTALAGAAVLKIVTLPVACLGLLALLVLDRRRGVLATGVATVVGIAYVGLVAAVIPRELQWTFDSAAIQPDRDLGAQLNLGLRSLGDAAFLWPALLVVPASLIGATRREQLLIGAAVVIALSGVVVQAQYYTYHFAALVVVASLCALATARRTAYAIVPAVVVVAIACAGLLGTPADVRVGYAPLWFAVAATASGGLALYQWLRRRRDTANSGPTRLAPALVLLLAVTLPAVLPKGAWSFSVQSTRTTTALANARAAAVRHAAGEQIRARIGAETAVLYLAFGDAAYYIRNPTTCRYPANVFLQRSRYYSKHEDTVSWRENLRCLDDERSTWLVLEPDWFRLGRMPAVIQDRVNASFDCRRGFTVDRWTVCPRRAPTA